MSRGSQKLRKMAAFSVSFRAIPGSRCLDRGVGSARTCLRLPVAVPMKHVFQRPTRSGPARLHRRAASGRRGVALCLDLRKWMPTRRFKSLARGWNWRREPAAIEVTVNPRLTRTLARSFPSEHCIEVSRRLLRRDARRVREALIHELAHLAASDIYPAGCRPHGPEWAALVRAAGVEPHATARGRKRREHAGSQPRSTSAGFLYEHRCPVCHSSRLARRPVPRWRCAACVEAGLDGRLEVRRIRTERSRAAAAEPPQPKGGEGKHG